MSLLSFLFLYKHHKGNRNESKHCTILYEDFSINVWNKKHTCMNRNFFVRCKFSQGGCDEVLWSGAQEKIDIQTRRRRLYLCIVLQCWCFLSYLTMSNLWQKSYFRGDLWYCYMNSWNMVFVLLGYLMGINTAFKHENREFENALVSSNIRPWINL